MIKEFFLKILNGVDRQQAEFSLSSKDKKLETLKEENAKLHVLLDQVKNELKNNTSSFEQEKDQLCEDNLSLQKELRSKDDLIEQLSEAKISYIKESNHYKHELEVIKKSTKQRIDSCAQTITKLRNTINSASEDFDKYKKQHNSLEESLRREKDDLLINLSKADNLAATAINEKNLTVNETKKLKKELEVEKEVAKRNVDSCNQTIAELREEVKTLKSELKSSCSEIKSKKDLLAEKKNEIQVLKDRIDTILSDYEELKHKLDEVRNSISGTDTVNTNPDKEVKHLENEANHEVKVGKQDNKDNKSNEPIGPNTGTSHIFGSHNIHSNTEEKGTLPSINDAKNNAQYASIKAVLDVNHNYQLIWSKNFFKQDVRTISLVSRDLEIADQLGKEYFVCACCGTPVKISKRTNVQGSESLFFTHCDHNVKCKWRTVKDSNLDISTDSQKIYSYTPLTIADKVLINSFNKDKETIYEALNSKESEKIGITDVNKDCFINSSIEHLHRRKADLYCKFHEYDLAIELQTGEDYNPKIVNKDIFYRLNKCFVLWIFGAGESGYSYLLRHVIQNTLFANKGNVFMFDEDARKATSESHILTLKFNYIEENGEWHYKNNENGILVNLDDLKFDDLNNFKPYIVDNPINRNDLKDETNNQLKEYIEEIWNRQTSELDVTSDDLVNDVNAISPSGKQLKDTIQPKERTESNPNRYTLPYGIELLHEDDKLYFENDDSLSFSITANQTVTIDNLNSDFEMVSIKDNRSVIRTFYVEKNDGVYYLDKDECVYHNFKDKTEERVCYCQSFRIDKYGRVISRHINSGKFGLTSLDGTFILGHVYSAIEEWTPLIYRVKNAKGLWGLRDVKGKIVQQCIFNTIDDIQGKITSATIIDGSSTLIFSLTTVGEVVEKETFNNYLERQNDKESNDTKYIKSFNELDVDYQSGKTYIGIVMEKEGRYYKVKLSDNRITYIPRNQVLSKVKHAMHARIEILKNSYDPQRKLTNWNVIGAVTEKSHKNNLWDEFAKERNKKKNKEIEPDYNQYIGRIFEFQIVGSTSTGDYKLIPNDGTKIEGILNRQDADRRYFNGDIVRAKVVKHLYSWCYQLEERRTSSIDINRLVSI